MNTLFVQNRAAILPWSTSAAEEARFRQILTGVLLFCLILSLAMPWLPVPKPDPTKIEELPPRYAKLLLEQQPPPAPAKPVEPPTAVPASEPDSTKPKSADVRKPESNKIDAARRKASGVGLLALGKELSALADISSINSSIGGKKINTGPASTAAAAVDTRILTADTGKRNVQVQPEAHAPTVGATKLDDNRQQITQQLLNENGGKPPAAAGGSEKRARGNALRGDESVAVVMDQHKSALHSIYDRARRANPGLKGKIVLVLTILPSGQVANVVIKSSELNAPELEASLVARIRQFDFGKREGGPLTVTIPVEFVPS